MTDSPGDNLRVMLSASEQRPMDYLYGTDIGYNGATQLNVRFGSYLATLTPNSTVARYHWAQYYKIISSANIILFYLPDSELTSEQKTVVEAEARLFRGLSYCNLGYLYGGVPIELEAVSSPKTDYVRASRTEVYRQAVADLQFEALNLPGVTEVEDGQVADLAAYHLLAETMGFCLHRSVGGYSVYYQPRIRLYGREGHRPAAGHQLLQLHYLANKRLE